MKLGLGTTQFWHGSNSETRGVFYDAYKNHGINVIDTAEMYGYGQCEKEVAEIIKVLGRDNLYIIDKILPENATEEQFDKSLQRSLDLLKTDHIDLFLLHWRENCDLSVLVRKMESAKSAGLIKEWGVSNFDVSDMEDLLKVENGDRCYANEIMYNLFYRGIEYDLLPYLKQKGIMPISYSTLDTWDNRRRLYDIPEIADLMKREGINAEALLLAFAMREDNLLALFNTRSPQHLEENMKCLEIDINHYMELLDRYFPAPEKKVPLEKR